MGRKICGTILLSFVYLLLKDPRKNAGGRAAGTLCASFRRGPAGACSEVVGGKNAPYIGLYKGDGDPQ